MMSQNGGDKHTQEELQEALRAISSMIGKVGKVSEKGTLGPSQQTLIARRLRALRIASELITAKMDEVK
jgi:hypothetical protein